MVEEVNRTRQDMTYLWRRTGSSRSWTCSTAWTPSPAGRCWTWPTPSSAPPAGGTRRLPRLCQSGDTQTTSSFISRGLSTWRWPGGHAGSVKLDNRVSFPLSRLDLTPYLSGPLQQGGELFDLYVAVCQYGFVSGGHYTAYAKHCQADIWNHFNDTQGS